jgi:hypothetical protein
MRRIVMKSFVRLKASGPSTGQVFDPGLRGGIGKLAGRDRHLPRCEYRLILGSQLRGTLGG